MARYKLGEIYGELKLKSKNFQENLKKSGKITKVTSQQMMKAFAKMTLVIGAVGVALTKVVKDIMRYGLEIDKMAKVTGLTTTEVQKLRYAAEQEHASMQALEKGIMNLNVRLGYAGDEMASYTRYFEALGIAYRREDGTLRSAYDVFGDLADVMHRGNLTTEETAAAMQLLGARAAKELIPMLKKGKEWFQKMGDEVDRLGGILDADTIRLIKETDDELTALKTSLRGFKALLAVQIIPIMKTAITTWIDWNKEIRKTTTNIGGPAWVNTVAIYGKTLAEMAKRNEENIIKLLEMQAAGTGTKEEIRSLQREIELTTITIAKFQKQGLEVVSGGLDVFTDKVKAVIPPVDDVKNGIKEATKAQTEWARAMMYGTEKVKHLSDNTIDLTLTQKEYIELTDEGVDHTQILTAAMSQLGSVMADVFRTGKVEMRDFMKIFGSIAGFLIGGPLGAGIGSFIGGVFGEGGVAVPKKWQPIFAAEGMAVAEKPTVSPGGNIYGERGWEVFLKGDQFKEMLKPPTVIIHNANPHTYVEIVRDMPKSDKQEFGRVLDEDVLRGRAKLR